ncbi:MAG: hypothetical protein AAB116_01085, partial [Candidatus Poribacteria bacterium]
MQRVFLSLFLILFIFTTFITEALSDGILIPVPPVPRPAELPKIAIKYHKVKVDINNQLATT